ncbi:Epoxide hydrolase 4, partial [Sarracenia purpurea var. burkii]
MEDHAGGEGPTILVVHGFPEFWYSWRHQMLSLSSISYRIVALDLRGYDNTIAPPSGSAISLLPCPPPSMTL